jgi:hypothetical protein
MEKKVCKCCGREFPIGDFAKHVNRDGSTTTLAFCNECMGQKIKEGRKKKVEKLVAGKDEEIRKARSLRLDDFTPRELMENLKQRGYEFRMTYTEVHVIDSKNL